MRSILTGIAAAAFALTTATAAFAQATPPAGAAAVNPYNAANIDPATPFGGIDVATAGANAQAVQTWAAALTHEQKLELTNRCQVIDENAANYQADAASFCGLWVEAMANDPGATPVPGLGGPNPMTPAPVR